MQISDLKDMFSRIELKARLPRFFDFGSILPRRKAKKAVTETAPHPGAFEHAGIEEAPALLIDGKDGAMPGGREVSLRWIAGTVLTGVTSCLLMSAALYVSFKGQNGFSTPYSAYKVETTLETTPFTKGKLGRVRPVAETRSERDVVVASVRQRVGDSEKIFKQSFVRVQATLATAATSLSADIPNYDPIQLLRSFQPQKISADEVVNTDIYAADVEGDVTVRLVALPTEVGNVAVQLGDQAAADFVRLSVNGTVAALEIVALGYAAPNNELLRELGSAKGEGIDGVAENVTIMPKNQMADALTGQAERLLTIRSKTKVQTALEKNGFESHDIEPIAKVLANYFPQSNLEVGNRLRILLGPSKDGKSQVPFRLSIYKNSTHIVTVALSDSGRYVTAIAPSAIEFPEEDIEQVNVGALPSIYRSIYETARKQDIPDEQIKRIIAMFAYDIDLKKRVSIGDSIEILQSAADGEGISEVLHVALTIGRVTRKFYRYRSDDDGVVDFYTPDGQTGKKFLMRRPLKGGGRLASRFGYRRHPIYKTYRLHSGTDFAAGRGTPIYAAGNGVVTKAQWFSGYGRYVSLKHANGYTTAYGHMSRIAKGMKSGKRVRQGQIIGYVGSTGQSTGNHLHYEIKINGKAQDPLKVRLPRDKSLAAKYLPSFQNTIDQIDTLMKRKGSGPVQVAAK